MIKSKRHIVCNLLKKHNVDENMLEVYLKYAEDNIVKHFERHTTRGKGSKQGVANLTHILTVIGEYILKDLEITKSPDEPPWEWFKKITNVGALFLEAFYQKHWINIGKMYKDKFTPYQDLSYNQKKSDAPYIIVNENWPDRINPLEINDILGIELEKPPIINHIIQEATERPVIKGWTEGDNKKFQPHLNSKWVNAINILQSTPWGINKEVHEVILANKARILNQYKDLPMKYDSKVIEFNKTMEKSIALLDKHFYYYMECDYRGRIYYTASFLNFQSNDIARGQLVFAEKKKMTEEGLYWLAIHTACSYNKTYHIDNLPKWLTTDYKPYLKSEGLINISVDKMTLDDRALWTSKYFRTIRKWWKKKEIRLEAEKPFSFLACCQEWDKALETNGDYYTDLPLPIDGSNNGWQHLSAISKDKEAGKLVGVVPQKIQYDFYVQTAKELIKLMPEWFKERPGLEMKHIRKGITKRGSMTRAYSAGALKIAENMHQDCHVEGYTTKFNITEEDCKVLAKNLVIAIEKVCKGPLKTMKFLQNIAEAEISTDLAKEKGRKSITWTTPSGFPVEYTSFATIDINARPTFSTTEREEEILNYRDEPSFTLNLRGKEYTDKPKIKSFMSGISPNFIHSMDATHMSLVINKWNGSFGPVHDSFSVHACDVYDLLDIVKDTFIDMYNYDNFFNVIEDMILSEKELFNYKQPQLGDLDITEVEQSDYFFA